MLEQLNIKNFILIEELHIAFASTMNVLTGETGSGKSMIIEAIRLLCGERGKTEYLRDKEKNCWIEGVFSFEENGAVADWLKAQEWETDAGSLVLTREIRPDGRSIARLDGHVVSLSFLKNIAALLLDLHGQDDRERLLNPKNYLSYIDNGNEESKVLLQQVTAAFKDWQTKVKEKEQFCLDEQERLQQLDFLQFQISEIEKADLHPGEEEELVQQRDRLQNAEKFKKSSNKIAQLLFDGERGNADENIYQALEIAQRLAADDFFHDLAANLESIYYELKEQKYLLDDFNGQLEIEPGLLDRLEDRLYLIHTLEKKYGAAIPDILEKYAKLCAEKDLLEHAVQHTEELEKEIARTYKVYEQAALQLRAKRKVAAKLFEDKITRELKALNMPNLRFVIDLSPSAQPKKDGLDEAEFLFSANPGEPLQIIQKIASGGELSRFALALKIALSEFYPIGTIILDEIDVGLGGVAQRSMALKMREFSAKRQLLLVTHAAQIAAVSARHFKIYKEVQGAHTFSHILQLNKEERIQELSRMLDGSEDSGVSLQHALKLLEEAEKL